MGFDHGGHLSVDEVPTGCKQRAMESSSEFLLEALYSTRLFGAFAVRRAVGPAGDREFLRVQPGENPEGLGARASG